jgi:hypothetical protein
VRNLLLTGGIRHPFEDASAALADILADAGIRSDVTLDIDGGLARLDRSAYDMVTVFALRWRMLGDPKYAPHRDAWAFTLSPPGRDALRRFVAGGGALFGLHTACLCFDDWPGWRDLLGGVWRWGASFHPPRGRVLVRPTGDGHPVVAGVEPFEVMDEVYSNLDMAGDAQPLLVARAEAGNAGDSGDPGLSWPVLWVRETGAGRVVCDALGHDRASLEQPDHRRIITRAAAWAIGADDAGPGPEPTG